MTVIVAAKSDHEKPRLEIAVAQVEELCKALLGAPRCDLAKIPRAGGAYLIYDKEGQIVYVGKAHHLKRRICDDHCGGDQKM